MEVDHLMLLLPSRHRQVLLTKDLQLMQFQKVY
jgi:hypothetical protein